MAKDILEFTTDRINVFYILLDKSGSMSYHVDDMVEGLKKFKKSFEGFSEAGSISICESYFSDDFIPGNFLSIKDFETDYYVSGSTAICYAISKGANHLLNYIDELTIKTGCPSRSTFIVFSDGEPCNDKAIPDAAKSAINKLNNVGVTTVFIAFGGEVSSKFGKELGFMSTIHVKDKSKLTNFMGVELSKSCKEQSRSMKTLGADFFSQAAGNSKSAEYSAKADQALNDDDWLNDI